MAAGLSTRPALLPLLMATLLVQLTTGADVLPPPDCALSAGNEGYGATCSRMSDIPERLHGHLRKLKLVNTTLTVLENGSLSHLPHLAVLDLSGNRIVRLEPEAFRGLPNLKQLNLAHNRLCFDDDAFPADVFLSATSLRVLIMHSNNCSSGHVRYPDRALGQLSGLETLAMNGLPNVPLGPGFAKMKSLKSVTLSGKYCKLGVVSKKTFASLENISVSQLSLRACNISKLDGNAFTPLASLTSLNLACNDRIGMDDATDAIKGSSTTSLDTVILDDVSKTSVILNKFLFDSHRFKRVRRLSVRANDIVAVDVRVISFLPVVRSLATGFNAIYSKGSFFPYENRSEILQNVTANLQLEVIDSSHLLSTRSKYRRLFCEPDLVDFDDFFREKPRLPDVDYTRPTRPATYNDKQTSLIPGSLQVIFLDHSVYNSYHYSLPKIQITKYNDMVVFNISNTDMNQLKGPLIGFRNLQVFDASNCDIYKIYSGALLELSHLKYLFLQRNVIGERGHGISDQFHGLYSLLELDLSDNKIASIGRDAFRDLKQIRKLNLRGNKLTVLGFGVSHMTSILSVDVSYNLVVYGDSGSWRTALCRGTTPRWT